MFRIGFLSGFNRFCVVKAGGIFVMPYLNGLLSGDFAVVLYGSNFFLVHVFRAHAVACLVEACTMVAFWLKGGAVLFFVFASASPTALRSVWLTVFRDVAILEAFVAHRGKYCYWVSFGFPVLTGDLDEFRSISSWEGNLVCFGTSVPWFDPFC